MKVILTENIDKVGSKGEVIIVKRGFARNYLIPRNFAIYATPQNIKNLDVLKQQFAVEENKRFEQMRLLGAQISALNLSYTRKVDEHENMYGSVSETDILNSLKENNIDIPKTAILMDKHIKNLGAFEVNIKLHKDITVTLHGSVDKEGADKIAEEFNSPQKEIAKPDVTEDATVEAISTAEVAAEEEIPSAEDKETENVEEGTE